MSSCSQPPVSSQIFLVSGLLRARSALVAVTISAAPVLAYAAYQWFGPGSDEDKYNTPVPLSSLLGAVAKTDQVRSGGFASDRFRPAALFSDPNFFAVYLVGVIAVADLLIARTSDRRASWLLRGLQAACATVLLATLSRTGAVVLAAYAVMRYGGAVQRAAHARRLTGRSATGVAVMLAVAALFGVVAWKTFSTRDTELSNASHVATIRDAVDLARDYPLIGAGLGNYGYVYGQRADRSSAQSMPFTILAEQGAIGLLLYAALLLVPLVIVARRTGRLDATPLAAVFLVGPWLYDYPLALDVSAVWLALLIAAVFVEDLRLSNRADDG